MIYEDERLTVTANAANHNRVTIADKFSGESMSLNREAFEAMCKGVTTKLEEQNAKAG